jgi:hypothetical protein
MWRYPFINLCFVLVLITIIATQHSISVFGPTGHSAAVTVSDSSDVELSQPLHDPATLSRAAGFLANLWQRAMVIKEWSLEYQASLWEVFNASSPAETDLLEARFHVANAEVFTGMNDNNRAIKELDRAEISLQAAQATIEAHLGPEVSTVREEIAAAETSEQSEDAFFTVPFETIKAELDHLLATLRVSKA